MVAYLVINGELSVGPMVAFSVLQLGISHTPILSVVDLWRVSGDP
jgi:ABC-type protease/lipase transport system fused ATPase/permease subunit